MSKLLSVVESLEARFRLNDSRTSFIKQSIIAKTTENKFSRKGSCIDNDGSIKLIHESCSHYTFLNMSIFINMVF